jgi:hypothetical protein
MKLNTAFALHKHKVIQNKKHIMAQISERLKRKLEEMLWEDVLKRIMQGGNLFREACTLD